MRLFRTTPSSLIHSDSLTQRIVAYTAMSYHSARTHSKVNKGKGIEAGEKAGRKLQGSSPSGVTQAPLHPPGMCCDNTCEILPTKEVRRDSAPWVFVGGWPHRHSLPAMYQHYTLPQGNLFSINHLVHLVYASEPFLPVLGIVSSVPKSKFPDASQWPTS